ncbi:MAG: 30S ribosomal protein S9 [Phycisphaerales bacterium]|nr:MAG: 30S ribosomal protein S9 [Phycisphaerales bacterium]
MSAEDVNNPGENTPAPDPSPSPEPTPSAETAEPTETQTPSAPQPATTIGETARPPSLWTWGLGRRKTAVARVRLRPGKGEFLINGRNVENYLTCHKDQQAVLAPLKATQTENTLDVHVNVRGGGESGQAGAVVLGVARALKKTDASFESVLRERGFLTRDSRMVERKKYGQRGARRRFQFSKR